MNQFSIIFSFELSPIQISIRIHPTNTNIKQITSKTKGKMTFKNQSEELIFNIAHQTFLSLWSYANPINGSNGKELCDILTMFGSNIAIFSVKERVLLSDSSCDTDRWKRKVIEASTKQIYGAEKSLVSATHIMRSDGTIGLPLPAQSDRKYFRIAIALGANSKTPTISRDYGKGFINIFTYATFSIIMNELDTAPDFFEYLTKKIDFLTKSPVFPLNKGEDDFLAIYLANDRQFPSAHNFISINSGFWNSFSRLPKYLQKKIADKKSAMWDGLIETISHDTLAGELEFGPSLSEVESVLRKMAAENRYQRRLLGQAFEEFLQHSTKLIESRLVISESGIIYVFLAKPLGTEREERVRELSVRCFIAKGKFLDYSTVIGIATEGYMLDQGFSLDLYYLSKPQWTVDDQKDFDKLQTSLSYFNREPCKFSQDEYPT